MEPLSGAFVTAVHRRLERLGLRFAKLVEQARDGTPPKPRHPPQDPGVAALASAHPAFERSLSVTFV